MLVVFFTALGVGGATIVGALFGFIFKGLSEKFGNIILAFAGGVMLLASVDGLIMPSLELGGKWAVFISVAGIFFGAALILLLDRLIPSIKGIVSPTNDGEAREKEERVNKVLLFVLAIAIHNLPEGIASGVAFGGGDIGDGITVALGIALQNIPEGMVIISPMLSAGISPKKTFLYAALTGVIEIIGTFIGYFAVAISGAILPFALASAGGCMLYVISEEVIPEAHSEATKRSASFSLLVGFCLMLLMSFYI